MTAQSFSILTILAALAGGSDADRFERTIRVSGEGVATAPPDMATIHTGVVTQADSATEAITANNSAMKEVLATLKKEEIAEEDIQTTGFNLRPIHKRDDDGRTLPEISGYQVTNEVRVRVRTLDNLGTVLDAVVAAGSNRVSGIEFGVSDPKATLDKARREAVRDAKHRAEVLAAESGVRVGNVVSIQEQTLHRPQPRLEARSGLARDAAVPVATGREEFRVTVQVIYAIDD